jgi:hypothetical protein
MRLAALAFVLLLSPAALAISRHEVPARPRALRDRAGRIIGAEIRLLARSEGLPVVRVGLGRTAVSGPLRGNPGKVRALLEHRDPRFIAFQSEERHGLSLGATELKLVIHYGQGNDLKGGEEVDVWTAWGREAGKYLHYFGVFSGTGLTTVRLPAPE